jgi:hypothetical protein
MSLGGFAGFAGRSTMRPRTAWIGDGVDDEISFGSIHAFERTDPFSLIAWINPKVGAVFTLCSNIDVPLGFRGYIFSTLSNRRLWLGLYNTNLSNWINAQTVDNVIPLGGLVQVGVSYSGNSNDSGVHFYVAGSAVSKVAPFQNNLSATTVSAQPLRLFGGSACRMRHFALWPSVLTPTHFAETYNGGVPPDLDNLATAPDPALWVRMDDETDTPTGGVIDHGTGGTNGTAAGGFIPEMPPP